jgi:hypothetical protein
MIGMDLDECRGDSGKPSIIDRLVEVSERLSAAVRQCGEPVHIYAHRPTVPPDNPSTHSHLPNRSQR